MARVLPRVVVNLKTYPEGTGKHAVALCKAAVRLEKKFRVPIAIAAQAVDVRACVAAGARAFAQHVDRVESAQSTGATRLESLIDAGIEGVILNHSERRLVPMDLAWAVAAVAKAKIVTLVCAKDADESRKLAELRPTLLAVEPPDLIGGDLSVTTANPGIVRRSVENVHRVVPDLPVLCGAGVKNGGDVAVARRLGAYGVLVASGVVKARTPARALEDLVRGASDEAGRR